jgi:hypothetical protein
MEKMLGNKNYWQKIIEKKIMWKKLTQSIGR